MNNVGRKDSVKFLIERVNQQSETKNNKSRADEFVQAIARIAVAQVCEGLGFQSFQQPALDNLAYVGVGYIREIGKFASSYANSANRTQCNVFDVIQGLEDLGIIQGFSGASDVSHSLSGSGVVKDIIRYVGKTEEIPFAYLIPDFPVVEEKRLNPSFAQAEANPPHDHIPSWLPKFPDTETCVDLNLGNEKDLESDFIKIQQVELNLQQNFFHNRSESGLAVEDTAKTQRAAESNPFLEPPIQHGEKEVSLPVLPSKLVVEVVENHISVLEPSLRSNEAPTSNPCESEDRRRISFIGRPSIHFKFVNGRKTLSMGRSLQNEGIENISLWFGDGYDGKNEKKRRAREILKPNMEYPQEVPGL